MSLEVPNPVAIATFGSQLDKMVERHHDYLRKPELIGQRFEALKGHEDGMLRAIGGAVTERMRLMSGFYEAGGLALEIVESRRQVLAKEDEAKAIARIDKPQTPKEQVERTGDY